MRKDFAEANPDVVSAFVKVTGDAYAAYLADSAAAKKIAELLAPRPRTCRCCSRAMCSPR